MSTAVTAHSETNGHANHRTGREAETFVPRFDFWETQDEYVLSGDLPGVASSDLEVHFEDGQLVLHGKVAPRYDGKKPVHCEYGLGDFHRSFTLGETIDATEISAELHDGVLMIRLPKNEDAKPRRIEITVT